jgi:hypothetical protein
MILQYETGYEGGQERVCAYALSYQPLRQKPPHGGSGGTSRPLFR